MIDDDRRKASAQRLMSIDALRGLDMFFIVGMQGVFWSLSEMFPMNPALNDRLQHAPWAGFHFYDLIFPLFAYIVGVSLVFSLTRSIADDGKRATTVKILKRSVILWLLGILSYGGMIGGIEQMRLSGVLQRLALGFCFAGLAFVWMSPRKMVVLTVSLLVGYWAMLTFIPVPGHGAGNFAEGRNLTNWIDSMWLPFRKSDGAHDAEGLLSTLPAVATTLLGVFAGMLLMNPAVEPIRKVRLLLGWGLAGIALGLLWHLQFPIIKKLWTSSFVLFTAGISAVLLALCYKVIDIDGKRRWCQPFVWIGMNAITIYMLYYVLKPELIAMRFAGGEIRGALEGVRQGLGDLVISLLAVFFSVGFCRFLYVRKIFLKV